jgi:hypothetical protein
MATSPSDTGAVPPEVIAIAVALAATMLEPGADQAPPPQPDHARWRWEAWD